MRHKIAPHLTFHTPSGFSLKGWCGEGTYGVLVRFTDVHKRLRVIKRLKRTACERSVLREVLILQHLKHQRIVDLVDVYQHRHRYLVFEHMDTDLHRIIQSAQSLTILHIKSFMLQILEGVAVIHNANIVHRDLKPANILVNRDCTVKIADFGLAREVERYVVPDGKTIASSSDTDLSHYTQTRWYRSPEMILQLPYGMQIDQWSVGCIFAEMIQRRAIFRGRDNDDQLRQILAFTGLPSKSEFATQTGFTDQRFEERWKFLMTCNTHGEEACPVFHGDQGDLLSGLLVFNPLNRLSASQALAHKYFFGLRHGGNAASVVFDPFPASTSISLSSAHDKLHQLFCSVS